MPPARGTAERPLPRPASCSGSRLGPVYPIDSTALAALHVRSCLAKVKYFFIRAIEFLLADSVVAACEIDEPPLPRRGDELVRGDKAKEAGDLLPADC